MKLRPLTRSVSWSLGSRNHWLTPVVGTDHNLTSEAQSRSLPCFCKPWNLLVF